MNACLKAIDVRKLDEEDRREYWITRPATQAGNRDTHIDMVALAPITANCSEVAVLQPPPNITDHATFRITIHLNQSQAGNETDPDEQRESKPERIRYDVSQATEGQKQTYASHVRKLCIAEGTVITKINAAIIQAERILEESSWSEREARALVGSMSNMVGAALHKAAKVSFVRKSSRERGNTHQARRGTTRDWKLSTVRRVETGSIDWDKINRTIGKGKRAQQTPRPRIAIKLDDGSMEVTTGRRGVAEKVEQHARGTSKHDIDSSEFDSPVAREVAFLTLEIMTT